MVDTRTAFSAPQGRSSQVAGSFRLARDWELTLTTRRINAFPELDRDLRFIPLGVDEPRHLSVDQVRRYNDAGHLFPIDIFSPTEIAEIRAYIDDLLPRTLAAGWDNYQVVNWHKHCGGIWDIVTDSRIIDVVSDLLGDTVVLRHRRHRPLGQPPPPRRRTHPHPRQRLLGGPRQRRIPQPITPMLPRPSGASH